MRPEHNVGVHVMLLLQVGLIVVTFSEAALAELALVLPPLLETRLIMLKQVLPHISLLSEALVAELTIVRLNSVMHAEVVEEVPSTHEFFSTSCVITNVYDNHLPVLGVLPVLGLVRVPLQGFQILDVCFRGLVLNDVPTRKFKLMF